jgi:nicotinamide riboside transporter PnuC
VIYHWTIFEQLLFLINFAATLAFSIYGFINHEFVGAGTPALDYVVATISLVGNITDIMSIILGSKKRISTFSWGFVACITLGIVSYIMGTIGTAIVYIVIQMPMQFVGFYL